MICTDNYLQEQLRNVLFRLENRLIGEEIWILATFSGLLILSIYTFNINQYHEIQSLKSRIQGVVFFILVILAVVIGQLPNFVSYGIHINEHQHIAEARKLLISPVFWRDVDGTTIGPIPIYLLSFLGYLNIPIDFLTTKMLNSALWLIIMYLLFSAIKMQSGKILARYSILPLVVFVSLFSHPDFVSYNGEVPTLVLISGALLVFWRLIMKEGVGILLNFALGALLVLIPFSKIQAGPIAVYIGLFYIFNLYKRKAWHSIMYLISGVTFPLVLISSYLFHFDIWKDFTESYILNNLFYAGTGEGLTQNKGVIQNMVKFIFILFRGLELQLFVLVVLLLLAYDLLIANPVRKGYKEAMRHLLISINKVFWFGLFLVSALVVYIPGNVFLHYGLFLIPPIIILIALLLRRIFNLENQKAVAGFYILICVLGPALIIVFRGHQFFESKVPQLDESGGQTVAEYLCKNKKEGDQLALWGWDPTLFSGTGLIMATRESQTQRQILSWKQKDYYIKRYVHDLVASKPRYFADSTLKNNWIFNYEKHNYLNVKELVQVISRDYYFIMEYDGVKLFERIRN